MTPFFPPVSIREKTKAVQKILHGIYRPGWCKAGERSFLLLAENDPALGKIIRRDLQCYRITGKDPDEIQTHFAADMSKHIVFVGQFYSEHCVREKFPDDAIDLDEIFRHESIPPYRFQL